MSNRIFKIGISSSYGGLNLGDEAILQSMIMQLRSPIPVEITVLSRNPEDTLKRHQVDKAVAVRKFSIKFSPVSMIVFPQDQPFNPGYYPSS